MPAACLLVLLTALLVCGCSRERNSGTGSKEADPGSGSPPLQTAREGIGQSGEGFEAVFYDVGKGDCILLTSGDSHVMVDTGFSETAESIIRQLRRKNVDRLDALIITHYDKDHVGGAAAIAREIPVGTFYLPDYKGDPDKSGELLHLIDNRGLNAVRVQSGQSFTAGEAGFLIDPALVVYDPKLKNDNDASLIIEVSYGDDDWLLPGDIEKEAIDKWIANNKKEYDVLKMPHHGKKEKNSDEFIKSVSPKIAVITDSSDYKISKKILRALRDEQADVYQSSKNGTITVTGDGREHFSVISDR